MKLKVCGMKYPENIEKVAALQPDYLGFIFWEPSKRYFDGEIPVTPPDIKKVGVFVDAPLEEVVSRVAEHRLQAVQLHGNERPSYCEELANALLSIEVGPNTKATDSVPPTPGHSLEKVTLIKVFSVLGDFDFGQLQPYETVCDYFLFDTKGELPGGNGFQFDWTLLENYPSQKPYFLSGGIGLDDTESVQSFLQMDASKYCYAIDVNSKFEIEPGLKSIDKLKEFIKDI